MSVPADPMEALSYATSLLKDDSRLQDVVSIVEPLAAQGNARAIGFMGLLYSAGLGVARDVTKAEHLLRNAVSLGDGIAAHNLGVMYQTGWENQPPHPAKAMEYFLLARSLGCKTWPDEFYPKGPSGNKL